ncbi:MAG: hypothetical protein HY823_03950 [Acidobacteria bacterium]|nr:hypothetical protein [Acidobacteriota bacterium]
MVTTPGILTLPKRSLYTLGGLAVALIAGVGFARSYYLKSLFGAPALSPLLHVHGFVMSVWVMLFLAQTWLVAEGRVLLHRRLGLLAAFWACLVLVVGTATGITGARLGHTPGPPPLAFLATPMVDMAVFAGFILGGLVLRERREIHRRFMMLASISVLTPALGRIPLEVILQNRPFSAWILTDLVLLLFIAVDTARNRRLHPVFAWGGLALALSHPFRVALSRTDLWLRFAAWLTQ